MLALLPYLALLIVTVLSAAPPQATPDAADLGIPFQRYTTTDAHGRTITFYLSKPPKDVGDAKLPLVLWVQGSGCQSGFSKHGERVSVGLQGLLLREAKGRVRVLTVEKVGVKYLDSPPRPGTAEVASEEFLKEHTLPRWADANVAAVRAAWMLPGIDPKRTLTMGHSEGGIVAARVAAELPQVTHVASLAGGGPTQLYSLVELRASAQPNASPEEAAKRRQSVYDEWAKIQADPDSITKFWMSHPYRRWSTFMNSSLTHELLRSKAKVYLVHATKDAATPVTSFDVALADLKSRNREVTAERLEGADHGFRTDAMSMGSPDGFVAVFGRVLKWFLE